MKDQMSHAEAMGERAELLETIADLRAKLDSLKPVEYLCSATRFKVRDDGSVPAWAEIAGRWVALVPAEDSCHVRYIIPVIPYGMVLVPVDPVPSAVAAMARDIQSKGGFVSGDTYRACITAAQKGGEQ